jgi:ribosome recycling factor
MTVQAQLADAKERMRGAVHSLEEDLSGIRTGRASPHLVDRLTVPYYGTPTPLNQMATIAAPEPRLLTIRPWDPTAMAAIEKAIMASDLGLTPSSDGQTIRLPIPILTEQRREELSKLAARRCEEARVAVRNVRRDVLHHLDHEDLPEDELHRARDQIQELTDEFIKMVDKAGEQKAAEIREN